MDKINCPKCENDLTDKDIYCYICDNILIKIYCKKCHWYKTMTIAFSNFVNETRDDLDK